MPETDGTHFEQPRSYIPDVKSSFERRVARAQATDLYEVAKDARDEVAARREWRKAATDKDNIRFRPFFDFCEASGHIAEAPQSEQTALTDEYVAKLFPQSRKMTPMVRDIFQALVSRLDAYDYQPQFDLTVQQMQKLDETGDLRILMDPTIPTQFKLDRMKNSVISELKCRVALDYQAGYKQQPIEPDDREGKEGDGKEGKKQIPSAGQQRTESQHGRTGAAQGRGKSGTILEHPSTLRRILQKKIIGHLGSRCN